MSTLGPGPSDVLIRATMLSSPMVQVLDPEARDALIRLVLFSAYRQVWTYSPPDPRGAIPTADGPFARIIGTTKARARKLKPQIAHFFTVTESEWIPRDNWFVVSQGFERPHIPAGVRSAIMQRDNFRCVYCGTVSGPFDLDHIVPVSQGGATAEDNLVCACAVCNRTKKDRTPEEWLYRGAHGEVH